MNTDDDHAELRGRAASILSDFDLVLEELTVRPRSGTTEIRLVVDLPADRTGSADLDTVADASRAVSALLDEDDSLTAPGPTMLEITTPGAERELTEPHHFHRARGRLLRLVTADGAELAEGTELIARLDDVDEHDVLHLSPQRPVDDRGRRQRLPAGVPEQLELPMAQVRTARAELEFSPPASPENSAKER